MQPPVRFGIDLGGTKTEIVALASDGRELLRRRIVTPRDDYRATLDALTRLVTESERELGVSASVGLGTPGSISRATGLLRGSNSVCLNGQPIKRDLERFLDREIRITNDANCFALSEATDGAGRDARVVFGAILGTGVGAGIVVEGRVLDGPNAIAGEWGHNPLPWPRDDERPGVACFCGRNGCIETWLAGPGIARDHEHATGEHVSAQEIVARAARGDRGVRRDARTLRGAPRARARARDQSARSGCNRARRRAVEHRAALHERSPALGILGVFRPCRHALLRNVHGDSSGVRGAAWLWGRGE